MSDSKEGLRRSTALIRLMFPFARDLANGFLVAEALSKLFPQEIQMHSFEKVTSLDLKMANWRLLDKFYRVRWPIMDQGCRF